MTKILKSFHLALVAMNNRATLLLITEGSLYSFTKGIKPDGIATNLHNRGENVQSEPKQVMVILDN